MDHISAARRHLLGGALALGLAVGLPGLPPFVTTPALARDAARDQDASVSRAALDQLRAILRDDVKTGKIPGAVMVIVNDKRVIMQEGFGNLGPQSTAPMTPSSIFRIASMTKPLVSAAAMKLVEQGKILLSDPVSQYFPEFRNVQVQVERRDANGTVETSLVAPTRPMTIHDLLRHTSGLGYAIIGDKRQPIRAAIEREKVESLHADDAAGMMAKLARIPLMHQPGSAFEYGMSTDVLGHVIEKVTGQPLNKALKQLVLDPLRMRDTGFEVPVRDRARFAQPFRGTDDDWIFNWLTFDEPPKRLSGGAGAVSTPADYARFLQMMVRGGELGGVRVLGEKTVDYMLADHLGSIRGPLYTPGAGYSFGLGFAVRIGLGGGVATIGDEGEAWWGGVSGPRFFIDRKNGVAAAIFTQVPARRNYYQFLMRNVIYGGLR